MIVDCHAHFDPRMLDAGRMLAKMDAAGVDRVALIPPMNDPLPATPERLLALMRRLSSSAAGRVLVEATHRALLTPEGDLRLDGKVVSIYARPDNEGVARLVAAHPDRFFGWIFLNPRNNPQVLDELERWRAVPGMIGVKLHPHWHDYRTDLLRPLLRRVEELGLPALVHLGFRARGDFRAICEAHPKLTLISAHAGFPFYKDLWRYAGAYPNLYVDLSSPYIDEALARAAVAAMGPERCLYGTDAPYGFHDADESYDYGAIRGWVERMPVSHAMRERILGDTFREILRLD
jgi:predicted TIM-barrel fold metal-dependent hydrolase